MKIGVLGTGMVGEAIASKLVERGHDVMMGSRDAKNPKAVAWTKKAGAKAQAGTFADAAKFADLVFLCTAGGASVPVAKSVAAHLDGKVLIDISNGLDMSKGMPPGLLVDVAKDSIAEQIQRAAPKSKVVKSLNTLTAALMVNPALLPSDHNVFVSANDPAAKAQVVQLLEREFGWKKGSVIDLGDLTSARAQEALIIPWLRLWGAFGSPMFNFSLVRAPKTK